MYIMTIQKIWINSSIVDNVHFENYIDNNAQQML